MDAACFLRNRRRCRRDHRKIRMELAKMVLGKDRLKWAIFAGLALSTAITGREIIWLFLLGGAVAYFAKAARMRAPQPQVTALLALSSAGIAVRGKVPELLWFFTKAGAFVFGSGLAIVPFLYGGVVQQHHWLTDRQFLDAVAVAMITPGPVVITAAFIGFLVARLPGALAAAAGVFLPVYLLVLAIAPYFKRISKNPQL